MFEQLRENSTTDCTGYRCANSSVKNTRKKHYYSYELRQNNKS